MTGTDVSLANMDATGYASPNKEAAAQAAAAYDLNDPDDLYQYNIMFPSEEVLGNCEVYINLPQDLSLIHI